MKPVLNRKKIFSPTGFLVELVSSKYKDTPFNMHSYLVKINVGCSRANHYHEKKEEWMTAVNGKILLRLKNIFTKQKKEYLLDAGSAAHKIIHVSPGWAHSVEAVDKDGTIVVFSLTPEDKNDTISYEL